MPLPQVNDRLKEIPAQALRTLFATFGQLLLVADRFRARAAEQLSGSGETPAAPPADRAPAPPRPAAPATPRTAPAQDAETARWRSLDKTGNVRLLDGGDEQDEEDLARPDASVPQPATPATPPPAPAPAGYTPTEPVPQPTNPAVPDLADPVVPEPAEPAVPEPAELAVPEPAEPVLPESAEPDLPEPPEPVLPEPAEPDLPEPTQVVAPEAAGVVLPVPNYDQLTVASLRARLRVLDAGQVQVLLDYEKAHDGRPAVIIMFERRLTKLSEGR